MMKKTDKFAYFENDTKQIVKIPYGDEDRYSLIVLLPQINKDVSITDIKDFRLNDLIKREGTIELPKFKLENSFDLNETLKNLGLQEAFTNKADFSKISKLPTAISKVIHKTAIDIKEEGTKAAAITMVEMTLTAMPLDEPEHNIAPFYMPINRPFYMMIYDEKINAVLFLGHIVNL